MTMDIKRLAAQDSRDATNDLTYFVDSLITTARLALDSNDGRLTPDQVTGAVDRTLEVAGALMGVLIEGTELLERETRRGIWVKDGQAA